MVCRNHWCTWSIHNSCRKSSFSNCWMQCTFHFLLREADEKHFKSCPKNKTACGLAAPQVSGEHFPLIPKDTLKEMGYSGKRQTGHLSIRWATLEEKKNRKRMEFSKNPCKLKKYWGSYRANASSQISYWPLTSYCHPSIIGYPPVKDHLVLLALPMPPYPTGAWFQREP